MGFKQDFSWAKPPPKKFKKVEVPPLVPSAYSSSGDTDENEDLDDTTAGPTPPTDPNNAGAPSSTWYSSGALVLIFDPFGHLMTKGENFELVFKRVFLYGHFFSSYNSRSSETLLDRVVNLNPMVLWYFWYVFLHDYSSYMLIHACWITSVTIFHHAFQILHIIYQMRVWITTYRGRSPWFNSSNVHCLKSKFLTMHIFRGSSSISCNQIPQYQYLHFICLSPLKT